MNAVGRVSDKIALVSGAAQGLGASQAGLLARHGARVMIGDLNDDVGQKLAGELRQDGLEVDFVHLDVTSAQDWEHAVERTEARYGPIQILVNNAGVVRPGGFEDETVAGWRSVIEINQTGVFLGIRHGAPSLRAAGGGSIVNLASISGIVGQAGFVAYQASKGAVRQLTRAAAIQYAAEGIRVNAVCPGVIRTEMFERTTEEYRDRRMAQLPMGRFGEPDEVAYAVLFLASDESSYMTAAELVVDGGLTAQ
ncbi:glucose 1-dehydrogenase [Jatrophihabitans cynanchi]|uniref:Glucose 1-dehydrogenase n=1 Tax=Jatrophihabitans cynanchi TaxID=2944128 RepID=A0ABY7K5H5_9ACTN|nr:glucose 1-dehydrogenase [Jatrophihabitans sp. SB3-54]WAX58356.1 glucose 1-dehydrogenase [Jatrophihabitans sp. SB3-54]